MTLQELPMSLKMNSRAFLWPTRPFMKGSNELFDLMILLLQPFRTFLDVPSTRLQSSLRTLHPLPLLFLTILST